MKKILVLVALVGCANHTGDPLTDGSSADTDGNTNDGNGSNNVDASTSPYTCTPLAGVGFACCVFDASACTAPGTTCQYDYTLDNSTFTAPSQGAGACVAIPGASLAIGAVCNVGNVDLGQAPTCGPDAWCAYDAGSKTNNQGTCRSLCDPLDQAHHGCSIGTCVGMEYCADFSNWPNCPSATNTHLGFCQ